MDPLKESEIGQYMLPNGLIRNVPHSEAVAKGYKPVDPDIAKYNATVSIDKALDRESREKIARMKLDNKAKPASKAELAAFDKFASAGSKYNKAEQEVWTVKNAMDVLNNGGVVGEGGIPSLVARAIFKEVGNLSASDLKLAKGSPAIQAMAARFSGRVLDGENLTPEDRKDLAILFRTAYNHAKNKALTIANRTKKGYAAMGNTRMGEAIDAYVHIPEMDELKDAIPASGSGKAQGPKTPAPNRANNSILKPEASGKIRVIAPDGTPGSIPAEDLEAALKEGYKKAQ